jgi:hypothetical protein
MSSHDEYATRYTEPWSPKEERYPATKTPLTDAEMPQSQPTVDWFAPTTKMQSADSDVPCYRNGFPEHFATEESAAHLYVPKGDARWLTSLQPRIEIPPCAPNVLNHARVLWSAADRAKRQASLDELKRLMDEDSNNGALEVLMAFEASKQD